MINNLNLQVSKYALYLLSNIVDYEASLTRDQERINLLATTNSSGKVGCCIPTDMCCEHKVRNIKDLLKLFHNQLETTLITKAVMAQNCELRIKDHMLDCLGKGEYKSGGNHRHDYLKKEEKDKVREELKRIGMFREDTSREKMEYHQKVRRIWENLQEDGIETFLKRNRNEFKERKFYRFN